jgi:hypothetical protein
MNEGYNMQNNLCLRSSAPIFQRMEVPFTSTPRERKTVTLRPRTKGIDLLHARTNLTDCLARFRSDGVFWSEDEAQLLSQVGLLPGTSINRRPSLQPFGAPFKLGPNQVLEGEFLNGVGTPQPAGDVWFWGEQPETLRTHALSEGQWRTEWQTISATFDGTNEVRMRTKEFQTDVVIIGATHDFTAAARVNVADEDLQYQWGTDEHFPIGMIAYHLFDDEPPFDWPAGYYMPKGKRLTFSVRPFGNTGFRSITLLVIRNC